VLNQKGADDGVIFVVTLGLVHAVAEGEGRNHSGGGGVGSLLTKVMRGAGTFFELGTGKSN